MARIRTIKPEFWTDETVADIDDPWTRLLFIGLWNHCDDAGRCVDNPRLIKAAVFPLDDQIDHHNIAGMLAQLASRGRIQRYEAEGKQIIQVTHWTRHQSINHPSKRNLPAPNGIDPIPPGSGTLPDDSRNTQGVLPEHSRLEQGTGNREQGSSSRAKSQTNQSYPQASEDDDTDRIETIIELVTDEKLRAAHDVTNPRAYRRTIARNVRAEEGLTIRRHVIEYPGAPDAAIAHAIITASTRGLAEHRRHCPTCDDNGHVDHPTRARTVIPCPDCNQQATG